MNRDKHMLDVIFGSASPVELNHRQASGDMDTTQQGRSADIDPTGLDLKRNSFVNNRSFEILLESLQIKQPLLHCV